jgi:hypothetical protein
MCYETAATRKDNPMTIGEFFFYGFIVWMVYMMTFRTKQFMELNEHMKGNVKDTMSDAKKAADVLGKFFKK